MKKLLMILAMSSVGINYCSEHKENKEANERLLQGAQGNNLQKVKDALRDKADIDAQDNFLGDTALMISLRDAGPNSELGPLEVTKFLITSGANTNIESDYGATPLNLLATCPVDPCLELFDLLIQHKANVAQKSKNGINKGYNALFANLGFEHPHVLPMLKKLIKVTTDINEKNNGETPLTYLAKKIVKAKASAERGIEGYGPPTQAEIKIAIDKKVNPLIEKMILLLESGADPDLQNDEGKNLADFFHIPKIKEAFDNYFQTPAGQKRKKDFCEILSTHLGSPDVQGLVAEYCEFAPVTSRG